MKKIFILWAFFLLFLLGFGNLSPAENQPPAKGGILPRITLPVPKNPNEKSYLGLSGSGFFRIPQIKAKIVIVEIFSLYCPACVKIAPEMKKVYQSIENNPGLKEKIKVIGVGAGNSPLEVQTYKNITDAPFPLFEDKDFKIHEALGEVRTPYFIGVKILDDGTHEVFYSELDGVRDAKAFLELVVTALGFESGDAKQGKPKKD